VLKIRILGADLPDSFQVHAGQELIGTWVVANRMEDLTFLFTVTLTSGTGNEPITVAMSNLAGGRAVQCNLPMAGSIMAALPTLIVYVLLGRYFIRGLLAGSVKG
jgi:glucose/mannose transport system permease protein